MSTNEKPQAAMPAAANESSTNGSDDTSGQRDVIDETGLATWVVREHPVRTKHDVVATSDHDAHAG